MFSMNEGWQTSSIPGQRVNISAFVTHAISELVKSATEMEKEPSFFLFFFFKEDDCSNKTLFKKTNGRLYLDHGVICQALV